MNNRILPVFDRLTGTIERAQESLSKYHCPFPVEVAVGDYVLGWQRAKKNGCGKFRICVAFDNGDETQWTPLTDCSITDRLAALPHISALAEAVELRAISAAKEISTAIDAFEAEFFAEPAGAAK